MLIYVMATKDILERLYLEVGAIVMKRTLTDVDLWLPNIHV